MRRGALLLFLLLFIWCDNKNNNRDIEEDRLDVKSDTEDTVNDDIIDIESDPTSDTSLDIEIDDLPDVEVTDYTTEPNECETRRGGAFITFNICDESLTVWIENNDFIDTAIDIYNGNTRMMIPVFMLREGTDCDPQWSWHVDPQEAFWAEVTIELCDGRPSYIEQDLDYWLNTVKEYCPWSAQIQSIDDRR